MGTAVAPRPVAPVSTGPAGGANGNGSQQQVLAQGSKEGGPAGAGILPTAETPVQQGSGRTAQEIADARAARQSQNGTKAVIEGGFGTGEPPGNIMENLAAGAEGSAQQPPSAGQPAEAGSGQANAPTNGREGMTFVALPPAADVAKHLDGLANDPLLKPDLDKLRAEGGNADALLEQAKVDYLQDLLKQPGGDMLVRDLIQVDPAKFSALGRKAREARAAAQAAPEQAKAGPQPSENTTGGPRPGEKATGTQATSSEATNGADVNKLAEPIAQVIREQDFAVAAARKAGEGVEAALAARRKAIQEAMNGALSGLTPEQQADFVLNQLNGRLSQTDAENRIDSQRGRFVRGAFREMRFHFSKGRQEIRDLYKFINENPSSMQGALIDAIAHGNGIHDTATEERMGNILLHIHNRNMGPVKRFLTEIPGMAGIARRFTTRKEMQKIAELQLQALSGQMSEKDLEKYKNGPLIWRLVSAVLGVVSPVAFEALSNATTQEAQAQGQG